MAFVPGFAHDIFISYALENDEPDTDDVRWVSDFSTYFTRHLRERLKNPPDIFIDMKKFEAGHRLESLLLAVRSSAILLVILTRNYVRDGRFALKELGAFVDAAAKVGKNEPSLNRILIAEVLPIGDNEYPVSLTGAARPKATEFWRTDPRVGIPMKMTRKSDPHEYNCRLQELAVYAANRLEELKKAAEGSPPAAASVKAVLLAKSAADVANEYAKVRGDLEDAGYTVLPTAEYPAEEAAFAKEFEADLTRASLFVQLLGQSPNGAGSQQNLIRRAQYRVHAAERAGIPILQWRHPGPVRSAITGEQRALLDGPQVIAVGLEEFKRIVKKTLAEPSPEETVPDVDGDPYIYITADNADIEYALQLQRLAATRGRADVMADTDRRGDFRKGVSAADAVVFLYGQAKRPFVDDWLKTYIRIKSALHKHPRIEVLYYAPPKKNANDAPRAVWRGLRDLGDQGQFTVEGMSEILRELARRPKTKAGVGATR